MARTKQTARRSTNRGKIAASNNEEASNVTPPPGGWKSPGTLCEVRNLYRGPQDKNGHRPWTTTYPEDLDDPPENADSAQFALVVKNGHCYDGRRKLRAESILIQSDKLKAVLGKVLKDYPGVTTSLARLEFQAPFKPFVHRWDRLVDAVENEADPETLEHVELLYQVLEQEIGGTIKEMQDHVKNGVVTFGQIWTIFEPGCLVYSGDEDEHHRVYKLQNGDFQTTSCGQIYALRCQYVDFDGENFGYGSSMLQIREFGGTAPISKLSVYPLTYHPKMSEVRHALISRGKLFEAYKGYHFKAYEGVALGPGFCGMVKYTVNSRIIVDTYAYNRFNPNSKVSLTRFTKSDTETSDDSDDDYDMYEYHPGDDDTDTKPTKKQLNPLESPGLTDQQLLIATDKLRGYSLKDKKWMLFDIPCVKEIVWNDHAFDSLVAPAEQKDLILAFAQTQAKNRECFDDVIQGKGRGIIMLLSGPPGVGKTLTAESVAEEMHVPLYTMSAGDLGTNPAGVEAALGNILEMNTKWNAVLLLDEADVFLEARSAHDLERNKLVSIFLRLLEYYEGILFLTTNRVDNIDAAFESRIHLSLQYSELSPPSRRVVWKTFLERSVGAGTNGFSNAQVDELAAHELNGRQIKNVLKTAQLLATKREVKLEFAHVETVLRLRKANERKRPFELVA
ncbi:P-loop containing nucleoside triphosphate hydrolase protein [Aulographum hederae CBS 113979]|uniref:P-loop containing nucleoside triphosphate hydrolase protein n=1 Tax=Aulographum hederae CBS 113979 TaxID=1176131 RepID=A0A6G1GWJ4_9PEZI|nr:P-loop containing nucleoside triphosphate hydrolase protein [Aulographum hederae CBS 113979]